MLDAEIVIVGGGPAGISTALFLAHTSPRLADRILVIERGKYPREKVCAGAIGARADKLLASIGARVDVPSVPIRGLSVDASGRSLATRADGPPIGRVVRRVEFDHAFAAVAMARGVRVRDGVKVTGLVVGEHAARLETSIGEIRARAVVGADGVGSVVRRALGLPRGAFMAQAVELDTERASEDEPRDLLHFDLGDRGLPGYAWDFPTLVRGEPLVCRGIYELRAEGVPERAATEPGPGDRLLARAAARGVPAPAASLRRFAERGLSLHEPFARPRVLLVGEAAGIDPALGEGIAQAIQYGAVAGPFLARALRSGDLSFASFPRVLHASRLGFDLRVRARAARFVYGGARPLVERWVTRSRALAAAGMEYFAGERVDRRALGRSALDLGGALLGVALDQARVTWAPRSGASP
ncbi:NAD(P)/FAD-dependent oxidoreductase [Polyangium spumosum]|uniref:NAD(P)/FAD-dependent oxidoreductase n=1 Tax=Polyangium spumosum TaxID=889282 RepID=A0A6N7PZT2_9BACT|nr:NAD(P)/FAD-dependent oxidoreductase [Polyangium spumosum]MRG97369.1 NAD(P)/FAD-dependent oxidoreductase [Polyangium spumosum]